MKKVDFDTALEILDKAKWKSALRGSHMYIEAVYNGLEVSVRDDSYHLVIKGEGKSRQRIDVSGTEEYEALFSILGGY
jgi:hypothetical protein